VRVETDSFRKQQKGNGLDRSDFDQVIEKGDIFEPSVGFYMDSLLPAYKVEALLKLHGARPLVSG